MVHPLQKLFESRSLLVVRVLALSLFVLLCTSVSQGTHMETHPIIDVRMNLTCSNTTDPCNDLLNKSCGNNPSCNNKFRDVFSDSTNISYDIRNTDQYQPSFILTVEGGDLVDLGNWVIKKGYVVGYRGCSSNPSQVCYIRHASGVSCQLMVTLWRLLLCYLLFSSFQNGHTMLQSVVTADCSLSVNSAHFLRASSIVIWKIAQESAKNFWKRTSPSWQHVLTWVTLLRMVM
jgi:hypothetical protein